MPLAFRGIPKKQRLTIARKYLKLVGVDKQEKHMPNQMSGGQQQRVGIARALVVKPQIIFADEPTGALNSFHAREVMDMFSKVHEQGTTILMVTHDVKVASYAQRICYINDGKIESNLDIGVLKHADELKEREKKVYNWLMEKGW